MKQPINTTHLFWIDLEFTGFDPIFDPILELHLIVTDEKLNLLEEYGAIIGNDIETLKIQMAQNSFWQEHHLQKNHFLTVCQSGKPIEEVDREVKKIIEQYAAKGSAVLAGNSIRSDRAMIDAQMPLTSSMLHYRMLDVTSFKIVMEARGIIYAKREAHRAKDDIIESIEELRFYLDRFSLGNVL